MSNYQIIQEGLRKHAKRMEEKMLQALFDVAQEIVLFIEGGGVIPIDTGNLKDSTGVGVYYNGSLTRYLPIQTAVVPRENVWGTDEISTALAMASNGYSSGLWIVVMSTMPYAYEVNQTHGQWFSDEIINEFVKTIQRWIYLT